MVNAAAGRRKGVNERNRITLNAPAHSSEGLELRCTYSGVVLAIKIIKNHFLFFNGIYEVQRGFPA
jgi:hypothetical protein